MASIITSKMRVYAANQFLEDFTTEKFYLFVGRTLPWNQGNFSYVGFNDNLSPPPIDCEYEKNAAFRDMLSAKLITSTDVSLVMPRYDWENGTIYTEYQDDIDLFDSPFFVVTDDLNVYKCLNNNGGIASTVKPMGTTSTAVTLADGYQWKYMLTINDLNFVTTDLLPVQTLLTNDGSPQWIVQQTAVPGTIDRIDVVSGGTGYLTIPPNVQIVGDGANAQGTAIISGGQVVSIVVNNQGIGYTWADVVISGGNVGASGATANAVVSPLLGHGADPENELGGVSVLVYSELTSDENGTFTISNDYRRVGLVKNPLLNDGFTQATALDYDQATRLTFGSTSGTIFVPDEVVTDSTSHATGVVLDYNATGLVLRLVECEGNFLSGETVVGADATGVIASIVPPDFDPFSGEIVYLENRCPVVRAVGQSEGFKIIIQF
jgi:hypothetical protein